MIYIIVFTFLNLILASRVSNSILHPVRIFVLAWSFLVLFPVFFWKTSYQWRFNGLIWIECAVFFTVLGSLIGNKVHFASSGKRISRYSNLYDKRSLNKNWNILIVLIIIGCIEVLMSLAQHGFQLIDVFSINGLLNVSSTNAAGRYSNNAGGSFLQQLLSIFVYLGPICGGFSFNYADNRYQKLLSILTLVPITSDMLFTSGKSGFIAAIILWLAGWCCSQYLLNSSLPKIRLKYLILLAILLAGSLMLLFFVMLLRTGDLSDQMKEIISNKFWVYAFGQMIQFDGWFADHNYMQNKTLGMSTYMMSFKLLGIVDRVQGVYNPYIVEYGNVFTAFRGVLTDFGLLGGLVYCFFRGVLTQACIKTISIRTSTSILCIVLVGCAYFWNLYGFIISPWIYTTYVLTMIGFFFYIIVFNGLIGKVKVS